MKLKQHLQVYLDKLAKKLSQSFMTLRKSLRQDQLALCFQKYIEIDLDAWLFHLIRTRILT